MDSSRPGSSAHEIFQARVLEGAALSSLKGSPLSRKKDLCLLGLLHWQVDSLPLKCHLGSPLFKLFLAALCLHFCAQTFSSCCEWRLLFIAGSRHMVRNSHAVLETRVRSLGREDPLEKGMATHSSILAWRIPWREEPGGLQSMGSQRVGHD